METNKKTYKDFTEEYFSDMILMNNIVKQADFFDNAPSWLWGDEEGGENEVFQWFFVECKSAYACKELEEKHLIFYYKPLDVYVLPVYHYGTAWDNVSYPEELEE